MLTLAKAKEIVQKSFPNGQIQKVAEYRNLYLFQIFTVDPEEGQYDLFYSVDKVSGDFSEFSVLTDGDISEVMLAFESGVNNEE